MAHRPKRLWCGAWAAAAAAAWLATLVALPTSTASAQPALREPASRREAPSHDATIKVSGGLLDRASDEAKANRLASADSLYRRAWLDPDTRDEAARRLHALHRLASFKLPVDQAAADATRTVLTPAFRRYDTPNFVVFSDAPADWSRNRATLLERTRYEFYRFAQRMDLPAYPPPAKLVCVFFNKYDDYREFARQQDSLDAGWVGGYYATRSNRVVFFNDSNSPAYEKAMGQLAEYEREAADRRTRAETAERQRRTGEARQLLAAANDLSRQVQAERDRLGRFASGVSSAKTIHEAIHLLAFNSGLQRRDRDYPFWLSEGLAMAFESEEPSRSFGPGQPNPERRKKLAELRGDGRLLPMDYLLSLGQVPGWDGDTAQAMYTQSGAVFDEVYQRQRSALARYLRALADAPPGKITPAKHLELFVDYFGSSAALEKRVLQGLPTPTSR